MMNLELLTQFDKRKYKKLFGLLMKETRESLNWSQEQMATHLKLSVADIRQTESGQKTLTQDSFDYLRYSLNLSKNDLMDLAKITQIQTLMEVYREINEQYPK